MRLFRSRKRVDFVMFREELWHRILVSALPFDRTACAMVGRSRCADRRKPRKRRGLCSPETAASIRFACRTPKHARKAVLRGGVGSRNHGNSKRAMLERQSSLDTIAGGTIVGDPFHALNFSAPMRPADVFLGGEKRAVVQLFGDLGSAFVLKGMPSCTS